MSISENEIQMIDEYSKNIDMQDIGLFWQLTIKTIDDLRIVGNENLTFEMYIMQLVHFKNLDEKKKLMKMNKYFKSKKNFQTKKLKKKTLETKFI